MSHHTDEPDPLAAPESGNGDDASRAASPTTGAAAPSSGVDAAESATSERDASQPQSQSEAGVSDGRLWFALVAGTRLGPFSTDDIRRRLRNGDLRPRHYVWRLGFGPHWYRVREVPELRRDVPADAAPHGDAHQHPGLPERILCTNCYARVLPAWRECPTCGHRLKAEPPTPAESIGGDVVYRLLGVLGALLMLAALALPWLIGPADGPNANGKPSPAVAGLDAYLGGTFGLLGLGLVFFTVQAALGGARRPVLTWALAVWALGLVVLFGVEAHHESTVIHARLDAATAAEADRGADTTAAPTRGLDVLGPGLWVYALGVLLVVGAWLVPAVHGVLARPLAAGVAVAVVALAAFAHLQLVNGNLYEPLLEVRLALQGYEVLAIERIDAGEPLPDAGAAGQPGTIAAAVHTYRILARGGADGRLYTGRVTIPLGSVLPLRTVALQRVPPTDQPLFEVPVQGPPADSAARAAAPQKAPRGG